MTQPDGEIPDSAIASLSAFQAKTQEDWDDEIRGKTTVPYTKFAGGWGGLLSGILGAGNNALNAITQIGTLIWKVGGSLIDDVGDFINAALSNAATALTNSGLSLAGLESALKGAFDAWFGGSSGTGTVAEFTYTIESIKDAVINGYTVTTFTSNTAGWAVPSHAEMSAVMIGGGQNGSAVTTAVGGLHGSFAAMPIDLTGITSLDIQVGTAGNRSTVRVANVTPHTGTVVSQSPAAGASGGIAGTFGLTPTNSVPGSGGNGGSSGGGGSAGTAGQPSGLALGGNGGSFGFFGGDGGDGGAVSAGSQVKCGGGGGGGGGGASSAGNTGGDGGAGGYPGGGGGGRGSGFGAASGSNGPGAPGVVWLFYR